MANTRITARPGDFVDLNMTFLRNGVPQSPFALRRIDIYRSSPRPGNIEGSIIFTDPLSTTYPSPATEIDTGEFVAPFYVPENFVTGDIYFDVWHFIGTDDGRTDLDDESSWISQRGEFWVFDDVWLTDDELSTIRLGFEPLDKKFRRGEIRKLEVAVHPLPLYDYDFNMLTPIIPQLNPRISIYTHNCELLVQDAPCQMGVRQGAHRNSPFVVQCLLDTRTLIRGAYQYVIKVNIENKTLISPRFNFVIQ